ncbi:flagellar hook-length control protein FliK [Sandarakinorhabdus sp.]|uniref:flagellar hook-length control protein FliK n=1 Tax=Sandarakinorhabdus sp. TaxID=1916663 RepID=UPI00286D8329|nr:flagellar hook-length control protein FliK [Sandarakinorhabdus sp.]
MLNLPSPQTALPPDPALPGSVPALAPPMMSADPQASLELRPFAGAPLPIFAGLLAAQTPLAEAAAGPVEIVAVPAEPAESPAIEQAWALVLVPELANLPAELAPPASPVPAAQIEPTPDPAPELAPEFVPATGAAAGDMAGRSVTLPNTGGSGAWPMRAVSSPRLAGLPLAADPGRVRNWLSGLPSAPPLSGQPLPGSPITATPPTEFILRNVTGQPIPFPTADQPPWYDPQVPPPWFDPANPPPAWSDPTQPAPLWYDPTKVPPAWLDPARVPAAWFAAQRPPVIATSALVAVPPDPVSATTATAALPSLVQVTAPEMAAASAPASAPALPPISAERARRAAFDEPAVLAERSQPQSSLPTFALATPPSPILSSLPAPPLPAPSLPASALPSAAPAEAAAPAESNPALTITSDRLGDVAVRLSGGPDQLQVVMQAQPAAAALIGADAARLSQDLAAAGVALAGLSVNGQRADLAGGGRERQRQSGKDSWRDGDAPIAAARRLSARSLAARSTLTVDRFA